MTNCGMFGMKSATLSPFFTPIDRREEANLDERSSSRP